MAKKPKSERSQKQLYQSQHANTRQPEKTCYHDRDGIDGKVQICKRGDTVEQPQAQKAAGGIDAQLPKPADGQRDEAKKDAEHQGGNKQYSKIFHKNLRIAVVSAHIIAMDNGRNSLSKNVTTDFQKRIVHSAVKCIAVSATV